MKKLVLLAAIVSVGFVSCKKDYTCSCTTTSGGASATATTTIKDTKKNATESCENGTSTSSAGGVTATTTCTIK